MSSELPFHLKYRPRQLKHLIGNEASVSQLQGIVASGKVPNALLLTGPSSAGKTTTARAFAAAVNDVRDVTSLQGSYQEVNAADQKTIDEMRNLVRVSRFAATHKRRVVVLDEAHQLLTNQHAAQILLKPLEEPASTTIWILCSMEPQRFTSGTGRAIANRCQQLSLSAPGLRELQVYGSRIIKREDMDYAKPMLKTLAGYANQEFRTMAQMLQAMQQWVSVNGTKNLKSNLPSVLGSFDVQDDDLAIQVMLGIYSQQYKPVVRALLDVKDTFRFTNSLLWCSQYMLDAAVLGGERHPNLKGWSRVNREVGQQTRSLKLTLGQLALVNEHLVNLRAEAQTYQVDAHSLMAARTYRLIKDMQT